MQGMPINAGGDKLYLGLAATNSTDGKESIPYLDPKLDEQLEYDVAKLVHRLSTAKRPVVGWLSSLPMQGDFDMQTGRPPPALVVYGQIEQLYTVRALDPSLTSDRCRRRRAGARASEGPAAGGAVRDRPVRDARRARAGVRRSEFPGRPVGRRPERPDGADRGRQVLASRTAARGVGRRLQVRPGGRRPRARTAGVDARGRTALAAHRDSRLRRHQRVEGRDHGHARQHQHGHRG